MPDSLIPVSYLLNASKTSLENAMLKRMEQSSMRRKELLKLLDEWAEESAGVMLAEWFLRNGEALMGAVLQTATVTELKPGPMTATGLRDALRRLVESA